MKLIIFESTLFGVLRPWVEEQTNPKPGVTSPVKADISNGEDLDEVLADYPELMEELKQRWARIWKVPGTTDYFIGVDIEQPIDRKTTFYQSLLRAESRWFIKKVLMDIEGLDRPVDQSYELNSAIRYVVDLFKECQGLFSDHRDKQIRFILNTVRLLCAQLVLDLSLRFRQLENIDRYGEDEFYTLILDEEKPKKTPYYTTVACRKSKLNRLLQKGCLGDEITDLWKQLSEERRDPTNSGDDAHQLLAHIENAVFLLLMEASFIEDHAEKLSDRTYCREWIQGTRDMFIKEDTTQAAALVNRIEEAGAKMRRLLPGNEEIVSAARRLIGDIKLAINTEMTDKDLRAEPKKKENEEDDLGGNTDFLGSFRERFISFDEFSRAVKASDKTVKRYLEKEEIRVLEFSSNNRFLYREDVEAFIDEKTS